MGKNKKEKDCDHRIVSFRVSNTDLDKDIYSYCDQMTTLSKNLRNVITYQIRQLMTGLKKEESERTPNEIEVIKTYEEIIPILNEIRIKNAEAKGKEPTLHKMPTSKKFMPTYYVIDGVLRHTKNPDYLALPVAASQEVIRKCCGEWSGYFGKLRNANKEFKEAKTPADKEKAKKKRDETKPPKYTKGFWPRYIYVTNYNTTKFEEDNLLKFGQRQDDTTEPIRFEIKETKLPEGELMETRIVPIPDRTFKIELVYRVAKSPAAKPKEECNRIISLDLGVDNFVTITNNFGSEPVLISGKTLKSYNRLYNKKNAEYKAILTHGHDPNEKGLQKTSKRINQTTGKRNRRVDDYCHKASRWIVNYCVENKVDCIVVGKNKNWKYGGMEAWCKQEEQRLNQNFIQLPFNKLIDKIKYKAEENGILVIEQEESYTSKACFINQDFIPVFDEKVQIDDSKAFTGYRKTRGLYKVKNSNIVMNADVNGSANILRKAFPNLSVNQTWISGVLKQPRVVNLFDQA